MALRRDSVEYVIGYRETFVNEKQERNNTGCEDPLPEHCSYRDEGCELAISCLNCPYPSCIMEQSGGKRRMKKWLRDAEIVRLASGGGKETKELAQKFKVSPRTIQRVLRRSQSE